MKSSSQVISQFEEIFTALNIKYFNGELKKAIITVGTNSRIQVAQKFVNRSISGNTTSFGIELNANQLNKPIEGTVGKILHEMVHEYCLENSIKDTSNNDVYHNRRFREQAEAHGLIVIRSEKYGWSITRPSQDLIRFIDQQGWKTMNLTGIEFADESVNKKSSTRRWICPKCKTIIRSTKEVRVTCTDCMEPFVKIDKANHCLKVKNRKAGDIA